MRRSRSAPRRIRGCRSDSRNQVATRNVNVGTVPTNLVTALPLTVGRRYALQNVDANARIFVRDATVMPTGGALRGHVIAPGEFGYPEPDGVTGVWCWTDRPEGASAVITEAD